MSMFKLPVRAVECYGVTYHITSINVQQMRAVFAAKKGKDPEDAGMDIIEVCVLYGLCDAEGHRILNDGDIDKVRTMPFAIAKPIADAVAEFSALTGDDLGN